MVRRYVEPKNAKEARRYLAIDLHKRYLVIGGVNREQKVVLKPRTVSLEKWSEWASKYLRPTDEIVIEATGNTWPIVDQLKPLVARVVVAHPRKVKLIAAARVKTDRIDVISLAHLLAANLVPEVWVPPVHVRELRRLISQRFQLTQARVRIQNELQSLLHRRNIVAPAGRGTLFRAGQRPFWEELAPSPTDKLQIEQNLARLELYAEQIAEIDEEIDRLSLTTTWQSEMRLLMQLPGSGPLTGMTILGAVGEISRFESAKKLVGYAGLGSSVHASGGKTRTGAITKTGRKDLRRALVQMARAAVRAHPIWRRQYDDLCRRMAKQKAVVAIARKLLVSIWHILMKKVADTQTSPERIGYRFAVWYWRLPKSLKEGWTNALFMRWQLMQLGIGNQLSHVPVPSNKGANKQLRLASPEEALAVFAT